MKLAEHLIGCRRVAPPPRSITVGDVRPRPRPRRSAAQRSALPLRAVLFSAVLCSARHLTLRSVACLSVSSRQCPILLCGVPLDGYFLCK